MVERELVEKKFGYVFEEFTEFQEISLFGIFVSIMVSHMSIGDS